MENLIKNKNIVFDKSYKFAIRIVKAYPFLTLEKKEFIISKQLVRSGTSIGANIAEANGAISNADFSNKILIASKECLETKYWLSILNDTDYIDVKTYENIFAETDEICKILFSIIKTTRIEGDDK